MAALGAERALARCRQPIRRSAAHHRGEKLRRTFWIALILFAACATPPPAPVIAPQGEDRYLVDPRLGFAASPLDQKFERIWRAIAGGQASSVRGELATFR